ncbi:N2,N2-dimethylguanosine tRNA methyltransferase [Colletotrichum cereale]|nr:N2,N2-dimethylguanosine tRNA methyltransferase [Colletotrichum cereale]
MLKPYFLGAPRLVICAASRQFYKQRPFSSFNLLQSRDGSVIPCHQTVSRPIASFIRFCSNSSAKRNKNDTMSGEEPVITYDGKNYRGITEGKATILVPADVEQKGQQVFYNPIQQFNRDLSVLAIRAYGQEVVERKAAQAAQVASRRKDKKRRRGAADEGGNRPAKVQITDDGKAAETTTDGEAQVAEPVNGVNGTSAEVSETAATSTTEAPATSAEAEHAKVEGEAKSAPEKLRPRFTVLDALSASGLRALRYSHELPFVTSVTANDLTKSAIESIKLNTKHNGLEDMIQMSHDDAIAHMYRRIADDLTNRDRFGNPSKENKYDAIDLDPYGTAAPFLDAAVQAVRDDGGLLAVTCTDGSHWAGHCYAEKCFSLYGGAPVKGLHSHEVGIRLILHALTTTAAKYGLTIEPQLSLSIDFYCRVFVKVRKSRDAVNYQGGKTMIMYNCPGCSAWETQPMVRTRPAPKKKEGYFYKHGLSQGPPTDSHCKHCGSSMHIAGPMYSGPLHNPDFIQGILDLLPTVDKSVYQTTSRIEGMLQTAMEEYLPGPEPAEDLDAKDKELARVDHYPFFVMPSRLAGTLSTQQPPDDMFRGALKHLGYRVTRSHCRPGSVKTDAPWETIWFVMREWVRQKAPVRTDRINSQMPAYRLLGLDKAESNGEAKGPTEGNAESQEEAEPKDKDEKAAATQETQAPADVEMKEGSAEEAETTDKSEEGKKPASQEELRKTLVFDDKLAKLGKRKEQRKLVRYQMNPRENWGPMTRAKGA